jgi:hypothetical protein
MRSTEATSNAQISGGPVESDEIARVGSPSCAPQRQVRMERASLDRESNLRERTLDPVLQQLERRRGFASDPQHARPGG